MENTKKRFNDNPAVVLPELASCLNIRLAYDGDEPLFTIDTPQDHLVSKLSKETRKYIENMIFSYENSVLERYLMVWLKEAAESVPKGAKYGSMVLVSILLNRYCFDEVQLQETAKIVGNITKIFHRKSLDYVFWVVSVAGSKDPKVGLKVWKIVMSAFIHWKEYYKTVMCYLVQQLEKLPENASVPDLCVSDYFFVYDIFHKGRLAESPTVKRQIIWDLVLQPLSDPDRLLPADFRKKVVGILPKFRNICCGNYEKGGRELFLPYLERVHPIQDPTLQEEILDELIKCLCSDPECSKIWENQLENYLEQTVVLLDHIHEHSHEVPVSKLRNAIAGIYRKCKTVTDADQEKRSKNLQRWKKQKKITEDYYLCLKSSEKLIVTQTQKGRSKRSLSMWNFTLIMMFAGILVYDTQVNGLGNFEDGKMGQFLESSGITSQWKAAQNRISSILFETHRHLLEFYPAYYEPLRNGAVFVWDLLAKTVHHSSLAAADGYYWVMERAPLVADKVEESFPGTKAKVVSLYGSLSENMIYYSNALVEFARLLGQKTFENVLLMVDFAQVKFQEYLPVFMSILEKAGNFVKNTVLNYDDVSWEVIRKDVYEAMALLYKRMNESYHNLLHSLGLCSGH
ncbi:hypothetical protein QYM36_002194 [Artemia franciscana]|nr:hypothetical protein QYM36_002194 [Artemia franciscana]